MEPADNDEMDIKKQVYEEMKDNCIKKDHLLLLMQNESDLEKTQGYMVSDAGKGSLTLSDRTGAISVYT